MKALEFLNNLQHQSMNATTGREKLVNEVKTNISNSLPIAKSGFFICSPTEFKSGGGMQIDVHIFAQHEELVTLLGEGLLEFRKQCPLLWKDLIIGLSKRGAFKEFQE